MGCSSEQALRKRGRINSSDLDKFNSFSTSKLLALLCSSTAHERTVAAILLGRILKANTNVQIIEKLVKLLKSEKALYTKIAICEALPNGGLQAAQMLFPLLGKIGKNQLQEIPEKPFLKKNFPLPRDIVARTLGNFSSTIIPWLIEYLENLSPDEETSLLEGVDALGYISWKSKNQDGFELIQSQLQITHANPLVTWKLIRCLQAFPSNSSKLLLESFLTHQNVSIQKETQRILSLI